MAETKTQADFTPSPNVARMQPSSTLAAMQAAMRMKAEGVDVVDFGPCEPDFDTPEHIKQAGAEAMRAGQTKYTPTGGTRKLQEAIAGYYERALKRVDSGATGSGRN